MKDLAKLHRKVASLVDKNLVRFCDDANIKLSSEYTEEEIRDALTGYPDFQDAWEEGME